MESDNNYESKIEFNNEIFNNFYNNTIWRKFDTIEWYNWRISSRFVKNRYNYGIEKEFILINNEIEINKNYLNVEKDFKYDQSVIIFFLRIFSQNKLLKKIYSVMILWRNLHKIFRNHY